MNTDPYSNYAYLREAGELHWTGNSWLAVSYSSVAEGLIHEKLSARRVDVLFDDLHGHAGESDLRETLKSWTFFSDVTEVKAERKFIWDQVSPKVLLDLPAEVLQQTVRALRAFCTTGQLDVICDLARPIRNLAVRRFLGLKNISEDTLHEALQVADSVFDFITSSRPTADQIQLAERSMSALKSTLQASDILGKATIDQSRLLNQLALLAVVSIFVEKAIANTLVSICEHSSWEDIRQKNPPLSSLVQEALRLESPTQITSRVAKESFQWRGQSIKEGHQISLVIGSANRDATVFKEPADLEFDRKGPRPLTFGLGGKRCPGEWLSSAVVEKVVQVVLESDKAMQISPGRLTWANNAESRRPIRLVMEGIASK